MNPTVASSDAAPGPDPIPKTSQAQSALAAAEARFIAKNPLSMKQHELAVQALPGGNTRTLLHTSPFPLSMIRGERTYVWDEDGHKQARPIPKAPSLASGCRSIY